jgi:hypothetical protein
MVSLDLNVGGTTQVIYNEYEARQIEWVTLKTLFRATSHTRLRAHDHYTSSTPIGGKGGTGPSLLHTTLEGPTGGCECNIQVRFTLSLRDQWIYVNARWM